MIIQIRGTSGSGKTWVMKQVMAGFEWTPVFNTGRKKPWYYFSKVGTKTLIVLGHYEIACGGCDTIGSAKAVHELTQSLLSAGNGDRIIIQEGLLLSEDCKWSATYKDIRIAYLTTDPRLCISRINSRRSEAGNETPVNEKNTLGRVATIERSRIKLSAMGKVCRRAPAEQAVKIVLGWIKECTT